MVLFLLGRLRHNLALFLEDKIGAPYEQIIIITTMMSAIPFSLFNYYIKNRTMRLLYSLIVGLILHYSIYGIKSLHTIISTIVVYYFIKFFGRSLSPVYVLLGAFLQLSILNIHRMIFDFGGWAIDDVSTIYMVHVAKYSAFAFSYADGAKKIETIRSKNHKRTRIENLPSILEFSSYIFFYPTTLIGPFIEYIDYINFIDFKDCYTDLDKKKSYILIEACKRLALGIFWIVIFSLFENKFPMGAVGTPEFREKYPKWWMRFGYMYICGPMGRSKYYVAWLLTYSSLIFSGMAYGEETKKDPNNEEKMIVVKNVDKGSYGSILYNEFGLHPKEKMVQWNRSIHLWLKYNIYIRVLASEGIGHNNNVLAALATYSLSAIWHGFYPSYYISFLVVFLFEQDAIFLEQIGFYDFVNKHKFMWPICFLKTTFFYDIIGSIFFCLKVDSSIEIFKNYYGLPLTAIIGFYIVTLIGRIVFKIGHKKKEKIEPKEIEKEKTKKVE